MPSAHYHATKHPLIRSIEPGETWTWCFVDEVEPGELRGMTLVHDVASRLRLDAAPRAGFNGSAAPYGRRADMPIRSIRSIIAQQTPVTAVKTATVLDAARR